jgi:multidrug transporter EmrE-like cation transporter
MIDYILLLIIVLISICELIGQSCLKYLNIHDAQYHYYLFGVFAYALVCWLLLQSYNYKGMGMVNVLWSGMSILVILTASIIMFNEQLTLYDKIGIVLILLGMFLVLIEDNQNLVEKFISKLKNI